MKYYAHETKMSGPFKNNIFPYLHAYSTRTWSMGFQARTVHGTIPASTMDSIFAYIHAYYKHHAYMVYAWISMHGPDMKLSMFLPWVVYLLIHNAYPRHAICIVHAWNYMYGSWMEFPMHVFLQAENALSNHRTCGENPYTCSSSMTIYLSHQTYRLNIFFQFPIFISFVSTTHTTHT